MEKLTKKHFKELYDNDLKLIHSFFNKDAGQVLKLLNDYIRENGMDKLKDNTKEVSRVDTGSQGNVYVVNVYKDNPFILVETKIDNSLNSDASRNDIVYDTIAYLIVNQ